MKKLRVFLIPFMAVVELAAMAVIWIVAQFNKDAAQKVSETVTARLPDRDWYFGE